MIPGAQKRTDGVKSVLAPVFAVMLAVGGVFCWWTVRRADRDLRTSLLMQSKALALGMNFDLVNRLTGTAADIERPVYQRLKDEYLTLGLITAERQRLFLLRRLPGPAGQPDSPAAFIFLLDSEPASSKKHVPPGARYEPASAARLAGMKGDAGAVVGPYSSESGRKLTAFYPLVDSISGKQVAVFGLDVDARIWSGRLARALVPPLLLILIQLALLVAWSRLAERRGADPKATGPKRFLFSEPGTVFLGGLALTLFAAWTAYDMLARSSAQSFNSLAVEKTLSLSRSLHELGDVDLEGFASFLADQSHLISLPVFQRYTEHLVSTPRSQAWEWVPAVARADRGRLEAEARRAGLEGFRIWEKDSKGQAVTAGERDMYYPVYYVSPMARNEIALGYDLGSEPLRRAALEESARTGLTTGSDPITLVQETGRQKGMLIYRPIYSEEQPGRLRGFALAVLRLRTVLQSMSTDPAMAIDWYLCHKRGKSELLAKTGEDRPTGDFKAAFPFFYFGKLFYVDYQATAYFVHPSPTVAAVFVLLTGSLLTAALTFLTVVVIRRSDTLRQMVAERTAALASSEARHRAMFEKNRSVQLILDPRTGSILDANPSASQFYGYAVEELRRMKIWDLNTLPQDVLRAKMERVCSGRGMTVFHFQHRLANGRVRDVEVRSSPITVDGQENLYTIIHDETEHKNAERALKRLGDIQRHLMNFAARFVNVPLERQDEAIREALGTLGKLIHAERACLCDYDFLGGKVALTHLWQDDRVPELRAALLPRSMPLNRSILERHRRGETLHVEHVAELDADTEFGRFLSEQRIRSLISVPLMSATGCVGFVGFDTVTREQVWDADEIKLLQVLAEVFANLKARQLAEAGLLRLNEERGMLLDTMLAQVWFLSDPETYGLVNRAHLDFLGLPRGDVEYRKMRAFLPEALAAVCIQNNQQVFREGKVARSLEWAADSKGEQRLLEIVRNPFLDERGGVVYVVCVAHDITERQKVQEQLALARQAAEQAARDKAALLADMSHEIRTPLNVIFGYAQIMERECVECSQKKNIRSILTSSEHLLDLVNGILAASGRDARSIPLNESAFDVGHLLDEALALFRRHPDASGLDLRFTHAADVPALIVADKGKIRQVLLNLVGNAVKFTEQGFVRVRLEKVASAEPEAFSPEVSALLPFVLAISVEDSGCGIPGERLESIFEEYVTFEQKPAKRLGTGIGLPLSRRYARSLGGDLMVASQVGQGSTFRFTFQARRAEMLARPERGRYRVRVRNENGEPPRVLVVDDNAEGRAMQISLLTTVGFAVDAAESGEQALEQVGAGRRYRVILLDKRMPGIDGHETLKRLRGMASAADTPVLLFTATLDENERQSVERLGGNGVISKPVKIDELLEEIRRVTGVSYDRDAEVVDGLLPEELPPAEERVSGLPESLRAEIAAAVRRGNITQLRSLVRAFAAVDPAQSAVLERKVNAYDYDGLLRLISGEAG